MNGALSPNGRAAIEYRRERDAREGSRRPLPRAGTPLPGVVDWPEPKALPAGLLPVEKLDVDCLPPAVAPWVGDIAERMQCPPDFVAVPALVALGAVLGRKVAIRPQTRTDWQETPNLWGMIVGRPGAMKSPAIAEAIKPLDRLEAAARKESDAAAQEYAIAMELHKLAKEEAARKARAILKNGSDGAVDALRLEEPLKPKERRYITHDATYEKLGEILADNPNGVLAFRDELVSLLKPLDREEYAAARGFFLTAWNGNSGYTFDRIIRGKTHVEALCLSLLGGTQPAKLGEYIRRAAGAGDDGLIQRFGLMVWPDQEPEWRAVDRYPDSEARAVAWDTFDHFDKLDPDAVGAQRDPFCAVPFLRFDQSAQGVFGEWRASLEARLRTDDLPPALESHFAKYRKLVPALALINHIADRGSGPISETALLRALAFGDYLESHARRCYSSGFGSETATARAILSRIHKGDLVDGFTARDLYRSQWTNLTDRERVQAGLDLLVDLDWLAANTVSTAGRTRVEYTFNPRGRV
jgi:putative DNA primase/helicase